MATKNKKATMEEEIKTLQRHMGGLVKNVLCLQSKVEAMEKKLEDKYMHEVEALLVKQRELDKEIAANSAAIKKIDEEISDSSKAKHNENAKKNLKDASKDNTSDEVIQSKKRKCRYFNRGYCKYKDKCRYMHSKNICTQYLQSMKCDKKDCDGRHPKTCKWLRTQGGCKRGSDCGYLHNMCGEETEKFECVSCKYSWEDKNCVVEHLVRNMKKFFCLNCDDWVKDKQKVLEHGWSLFDDEGYLKVDL